jgi:hypothetical protein
MTSDHVHSYTPIAGECGQYVCACGQTAYRRWNGELRAHKQIPLRRPAQTATSKTDGGRVSPRIVDDWNGPKGADE